MPHTYSGCKVQDAVMLGLCLLILTFWSQNKVFPPVSSNILVSKKAFTEDFMRDTRIAVGMFYIAQPKTHLLEIILPKDIF